MTTLPPITGVPPWPGGYSTYPDDVDTYTTETENALSKKINDIAAAIVAIENVLGTDPGGVQPTVKAALVSLQSTLNTLTASQTNLAAEVSVLSAIPGPPNTYYRFIQGTPITTWVINHPLGRYPSVMVTDSAGTVVEGEITYNSATRVTVVFSSAFAGEAYLS